MRGILAAGNRQLLQPFAWSNVLLAFDFDGTLAPIVDDPKDAALPARTARLLTELCGRYACAVLSGRSQADVAARLRGIPLAAVIGNHGLAAGETLVPYRRQVQRWKRALSQRLEGLQGVVLEDKDVTLAIHYRRCRQKKRALPVLREAVAALPCARVIAGKQVLNVVPEGGPHKGVALVRLKQKLGCDTCVYVGDDATDEDVFSLGVPGQLLGIRVGASRRSHAAYFLPAQRDLDALLEELLRLRAQPARAAP